MRAMHLYEDISPPYPEVFRASAYVNAKGGEEANKPIMERPGGYRRKKELGGRRKPEGRGEGEKQQEGLAPSLGLGEGWPVMGMGFGQNKGPSWIGRPFGNKVLALFYFPT